MRRNRDANGPSRRTDWNTVDWRRADRLVRNRRQRIFRATQANDRRRVRALQKLLLRSCSNILISVRRVTQVHAGKYTPDVDKLVVKTPAARSQLVDHLVGYQPWRASPVRRVYIPKKSDSSQRRPREHPDYPRPLPPSPGQERPGAGRGGPFRGEQLRIPSRPQLPRRDRPRLPLLPA